MIIKIDIPEITGSKRDLVDIHAIFTRYAINADKGIIRFYHADIKKMSYWLRSTSYYEWAMRNFERTMMTATGLKRIAKSHDNQHCHVNYKIRKDLFKQAAVAVRMAHGEPDELLFKYR